jgi:hypothetical protein
VTDTTATFSPPRRPRIARDIIIVAVVVIVAVVAHILWAGRHMRVELAGNTLVVRGDLLGPTLRVDQLDLGGARIVDPRQDPQASIAGTVFGGGLAGYRSGWFRLADGRRAQVFARDGEPTVLIPTNQGYALVVSVPQADAFIAALRKRYQQSRD